MKKNYESPKAEKMEFNYSETVVAQSGSIPCGNYHTVGQNFPENNCSSEYVDGTYYVSNQA